MDKEAEIKKAAGVSAGDCPLTDCRFYHTTACPGKSPCSKYQKFDPKDAIGVSPKHHGLDNGYPQPEGDEEGLLSGSELDKILLNEDEIHQVEETARIGVALYDGVTYKQSYSVLYDFFLKQKTAKVQRDFTYARARQHEREVVEGIFERFEEYCEKWAVWHRNERGEREGFWLEIHHYDTLKAQTLEKYEVKERWNNANQ